jgi:hypothetical protein
MKQLIALSILFSANCSAEEPSRLLGTWTSDKERTMSFIRERVKLPEKSERFFGEIMGKLEVTFTETEVAYEMPDVYVTVGDEQRLTEGFREKSSYVVLYENEKTIIVSGTAPVSGEKEATVYTFVEPDVMWVYIGSVDPFFPNLHIREYFKRNRDE